MQDIAFDLRYLTSAILAAEHGRFRRAAEVMNLSQSTLSCGIQLLERRLATPSFERNRTGERFTHSPHEVVPLPVALRPEGCMEREWAIQAPESASREWRSAYVSGAIGTLHSAVEQGLVVGLFMEATISGKLRRLDAAEDFPSLPQAEIALHMAADRISTPALKLLVENLAERLRKSERPGSPPRN
jgi:DNA-binding transcriptional LysR family regulator